MTAWPRLLGTYTVLLAAAGSLALGGCSGTKESMKQAGDKMGDAGQTAASGAAQTALAPAVNPVIDMLQEGRSEVEAGNLDKASATMAGFKPLWEKASPVIKPLAGDKFPAIENAANTLISTFSGGQPDAGPASAAISGLLGPLSSLMGS
ncbi:hypothetical protein KQ302_05170 [Synechococcus sp. CS-602]|uniref:hypothetical protein n=1 Tax=Synechococcaceae TaxID=1890426 RepID=UPI0008FF7139|nr:MULTISPECIES: hypothetical protein [Synechococcaceae]MCT4363780.1 hypothetical protein [Candidatus Regnicoccus frigidus MAG-AL1]APD47970.1 hypothetical protein BM449_06535 [Synechococcus sp. SynAce01]MCT0201061.1 hypothetical protein [Synechococcus sp. CS-603]MCT0204502.1 hypothetical protein [Synechococcus sp. CS-602]MCT0245405.1 hypothetical protein [Synechococcus sp. CS-601]